MSAASYDLNDPFDFRSLDRYRSQDGSSEDIADKNPANWMIVADLLLRQRNQLVGGWQKCGHPKNTKIEENKLNLRIKRN